MAKVLPSFKLNDLVIRGCKSLFPTPNKVQMEVLPYFMESHEEDLVIIAPPYTGKTSSVILGILNSFLENNIKHQYAVFLAPTYNIAEETYSKYKSLACSCGVSVFFPSKNKLTAEVIKQHPKFIIFSTAEKILELSRSSVICLKKVSFFCIDEADGLNGPEKYFDNVLLIHQLLNIKCRTIMCTSSINDYITKFIDSHLLSPITISVMVEISRKICIKRLCAIFENGLLKEKVKALRYLISMDNFPGNTVIFCETKENVNDLAAALEEKSVNAVVLFGNQTASRRKNIIEDFENGVIKVLITTHAFTSVLPAYKSTKLVHYDQILNKERMLNVDAYCKREKLLSKNEKCLEVYFIEKNWTTYHFNDKTVTKSFFEDVEKINCDDIQSFAL